MIMINLVIVTIIILIIINIILMIMIMIITIIYTKQIENNLLYHHLNNIRIMMNKNKTNKYNKIKLIIIKKIKINN